MPVAIMDAAGSDHLNQSEYLHDLAKLARRPAGVDECDPYREHFGQADGYTERTYLIPWSTYRVARDWFLGYTTTELSPGLDPAVLAAARAFWGGIPADASLLPPQNVATLKREIPAQDPTHPWLFAADWQVLEGHGVVVEDSVNLALDADGGAILDDDGDPMVVPTIAYADNSLAGNVMLGGTPDNLPQRMLDTDLGGDFRTGRFKDGKVRVRVTYRPRKYAILNDQEVAARPAGELARYVTREEKFSLEVVSLARLAANGSTLPQLRFWEGPALSATVTVDLKGRVVPEAGVRQLPGAILRYTWHDVPDRPLSAYSLVLGRVNSNPFDGMGGAPLYPAGTLLCQPWETTRKVSSTGRVSWDIVFNFMFKPQGWNKFLTAYGKFYGATFSTNSTTGDVNGEPVYPSADFGLLFRIPVPVRYR